MENFEYKYPVCQYFGKGCAEHAIKREMKNVGEKVLLAYGKESIKCTGLYDRIYKWLMDSGKKLSILVVSCRIPLMRRCKKALGLYVITT